MVVEDVDGDSIYVRVRLFALSVYEPNGFKLEPDRGYESTIEEHRERERSKSLRGFSNRFVRRSSFA